MNTAMRPQSPPALQGRHAVVTGAGSGIGMAIAKELAQQGATLTLMGRRQAPLYKLYTQLQEVHGQGVHGVVTVDITDEAMVRHAFALATDQRGPVSVLVNNAGAAVSAPFLQTDALLWQRMLAVNLNGSFHCIHAVLADMQRAGWGRIVNIASTAGLIAYPYVSAYSAAKHGLIGLTRALALEVATQGITVNAVCPGFTDTPLLTKAMDHLVKQTGRSLSETKRALTAHNPQGRLVQAAEVAHVVGWLCLPASQAIHGQAIAVAGGEVMCG